MHDHYNPTEKTSFTPQVTTRDAIEQINLRRLDMRDKGASDADMRAATNEMLVEAGQAPLAENEAQRVFNLMNEDGQIVEQNIAVNEDFGTFVRTRAELVEDGFPVDTAELHHESNTDVHLGDVALEAVGVEVGEASSDTQPNALDSLLEDQSWKTLDRQRTMLITQTKALVSRFAEIDGMLTNIKYSGTFTELHKQELTSKFVGLRMAVDRSQVDSDFLQSTSTLRGRSEEARDAIVSDEDADLEDSQRAAKLETAASELDTAGSIALGQYDELRQLVTARGRFESILDELKYASYGQESNIAELQSMIGATAGDLNNLSARLLRLQAVMEDVDRLRTAN